MALLEVMKPELALETDPQCGVGAINGCVDGLGIFLDQKKKSRVIYLIERGTEVLHYGTLKVVSAQPADLEKVRVIQPRNQAVLTTPLDEAVKRRQPIRTRAQVRGEITAATGKGGLISSRRQSERYVQGLNQYPTRELLPWVEDTTDIGKE